MKPYYQDSACTIYHGDCREIMPFLPKEDYAGCRVEMLSTPDLLLTDPPYGINYKSTHQFSIDYGLIRGDDEAFSPAHLLAFKHVVLWGGNNFANRLPIGGWVCWDKRLSEAADKILGSPFELAWCNNQKLYRMVRLLHGGAKNADARNGDVANEARFHPTQKPVRLMTACIAMFPGAQTILDPYMGSGSTLRAAKDLGRKAIGIEIEERYCEIAANRLSQEVLALA